MSEIIHLRFFEHIQPLLENHGVEHPSIKTLVHDKDVRAIVFSNDSQRVITGCDDGIGRIWDVDSGELLLELVGHGKTVWAVCFTPDDSQVITGSADETAKIWNSTTGELKHTLEEHTDIVQFVLADPDGSNVITIDKNSIKIWNREDGQLLEMEYLDSCVDIAWIPGEGILMTNDHHGMSMMRNLKTGAVLPVPDSEVGFKGKMATVCTRYDQIKSWHKKSKGGIRFYSSERAITRSESEIIVLNTKTGEMINKLGILDEDGNPLLFDYKSIVLLSGERLLCRHDDGIIRLWNWQTGDIIPLCESTPKLDRVGINGHAGIISPDRLVITSGVGCPRVMLCSIYDKKLEANLYSGPFTHLLLCYYFFAYPKAFHKLYESSENARNILELCDDKLKQMMLGNEDSKDY